MKRTSGRNLFVTDLAKVLRGTDPAHFAAKCRRAHLDGIWIRAGRGPNKDANLQLPKLVELRTELANAGVELWGWHVPFCANKAAAVDEASKVLSWTDEAQLAGMVVDAERTPENPRFRGSETEAVTYLDPLRKGLEATGRGIAFSSHDQPSLHRDMPFAPFLEYIEDVCPQVYYTSARPETRLRKSMTDYQALIPANDFVSRYKPTGNITIGEDVGFPDVPTCLSATKKFFALIATNGFTSSSFWCADTTPEEIWQLFSDSIRPSTPWPLHRSEEEA